MMPDPALRTLYVTFQTSRLSLSQFAKDHHVPYDSLRRHWIRLGVLTAVPRAGRTQLARARAGNLRGKRRGDWSEATRLAYVRTWIADTWGALPLDDVPHPHGET